MYEFESDREENLYQKISWEKSYSELISQICQSNSREITSSLRQSEKSIEKSIFEGCMDTAEVQ